MLRNGSPPRTRRNAYGIDIKFAGVFRDLQCDLAVSRELIPFFSPKTYHWVFLVSILYPKIPHSESLLFLPSQVKMTT